MRLLGWKVMDVPGVAETSKTPLSAIVLVAARLPVAESTNVPAEIVVVPV